MKKETVLKKLQRLVSKRRGDSLKRARNKNIGYSDEFRAQLVEEATRIRPNNVTDLQYRQRRGYFTNYKDSCGFDVETMVGHSYRWYRLLDQVKGKVILNTFSYSTQTAKHWRKVASVLRDLNVKFYTVEAPGGLQDLPGAMAYHVNELAAYAIKDKYSRGHSYKAQIRMHEKKIEFLKGLNVKCPRGLIASAIRHADARRTSRLERERTDRAEARLRASRETVTVPLSNFAVPSNYVPLESAG
jgi:hypothetical protein